MSEDQATPAVPEVTTPETEATAEPEVTVPETEATEAPKTAAEKVAHYFEKAPTVTSLEKKFQGQSLNDIQDLLSRVKAELIKLV